MIIYNYIGEHLDGAYLTCDVVFTGPFPLERSAECCWCGSDLPEGEMAWRGEIQRADLEQTSWFCKTCHQWVVANAFPFSPPVELPLGEGRLLLLPRRPAKPSAACSWCHHPLDPRDLVRPAIRFPGQRPLVLCPGCELTLRGR